MRGILEGAAARLGHAHGRKWTRTLALQAVLCLAAAAASSSPAAAAKLRCAHASAAPSHLTTRAATHALQCLVNGVRAQHGLRPVRANARLGRAARGHSADMATHDYFAHDSPRAGSMQARIKRAGYLRSVREWWLGEALAWGKSSAGAPQAILRGLLNSPPHRAILLDPAFRDLGIGVAHGAPSGGNAGALTVTLDFGRVRR
ncbi:MAG TPA: CAP domain-containing protein [Baekduia sp.]